MNVTVLGDGVTAQAVRHFLNETDLCYESSVDEADVIVTSPGIPPQQFPKTNVDIISDLEFVYRFFSHHDFWPTIIGVTGTNGKTTVAEGIAHVLQTNCYGNNGEPLIRHIDRFRHQDVIVLELSSYQLYSSPSLMCDIAVILNVESDHLEWHESFDNYLDAKLSIIKHATQTVFISSDVIKQRPSLATYGARMVDLDLLDNVLIQGFEELHNQKNLAIISAVCEQVGVSKKDISDRLKTFSKPKYRCEVIHSSSQLSVINDSKSTNIHSTMAALSSYGGNTLLILSGNMKQPLTDEIIQTFLTSVSAIYVAGNLSKNKDTLSEFIQDSIRFFSTLKDATMDALDQQSTGTILLSPGGDSFDEFENYVHRGDCFSEYVNEYFSKV